MKILVITGLYRSGTTLLQKSLNSNPKIHILNQGIKAFFKKLENLFFTKMNYPFNDRFLGLEYFEPDKNYLNIFFDVEFTKSDINNLIKQIEDEIRFDNEIGNFQTYPAIKWIECLKLKLRPAKAIEVMNDIIEAIHLYFGDKKSMVIGFKELNLEQFVIPLINCFKERFKVIHIIRDPRAIMASRNYGSYVNSHGRGKLHPILYIARLWRNSIRYKYLLNNYHSNYLPVKYELLVKDSVQELTNICRFIDIDYSEEMLDSSKYKNEAGKIWKSNSSFHNNVDGFDTAPIDRWKKILPKSETAALEFMCKYDMIREGYTLENNDEEEFNSFINHQDDIKNIKDWANKMNLILDMKQKKYEISRDYLLHYT